MPIGQAPALALTLALELPMVALATQAHPRQRGMQERALVVAALGSLLTHPFAWRAQEALAWRLSGDQRLAGWALVEGGVVLVEALLLVALARWRPGFALGVSLLSNGVSAATALVLTA